MPILHLRNGRLLRLGLVLTPIVMIAAITAAYQLIRWPNIYSNSCYMAESRIDFRIEFKEHICDLWQRSAESKKLTMINHRGTSLYNPLGLMPAEFDYVADNFRRHYDGELRNYRWNLVGTWVLIVMAGAVSAIGLWLSFAIIDWVLAG